jgi:hypothetical protein
MPDDGHRWQSGSLPHHLDARASNDWIRLPSSQAPNAAWSFVVRGAKYTWRRIHPRKSAANALAATHPLNQGDAVSNWGFHQLYPPQPPTRRIPIITSSSKERL